jgi:hypothetical protein
LADAAASRPPGASIEAQFKAWYRDIPGSPVFIVAAEGGGIRAAYWTAIVLGQIQDAQPQFARHVFAISGISGGSLGGAVFSALIAEERLQRGHGRQLPCGRMRACAGEVLKRDFLSPTLAKMIAPDVAQRFLPFPIAVADRARALEDGWAVAWRHVVKTDRFNQPFLSLWPARDAAGVPSLALNGTHVETGRRILTTNLRWRPGELHDAYDLLQVLGSDTRLKTAVHNSARFTYISPAGTMRPQGAKARGHVVDGGYFENSGATTALELLAAVRRACGSACDDNVYVIYLRNSPETDPDRTPDPAHPELDFKDLEPFTESYPRLNELLSPPRALLNTRNARGSFAVKNLRAATGHPTRQGFFEIGLCEKVQTDRGPKRAPLPLGWQLSTSARQAMETQLDKGCRGSDNPGMIRKIGDLLRPGPPPAPQPLP